MSWKDLNEYINVSIEKSVLLPKTEKIKWCLESLAENVEIMAMWSEAHDIWAPYQYEVATNYRRYLAMMLAEEIMRCEKGEKKS